MNILHLYYFQTLADTQHYTQASEILHTNPSNISYAISQLEQEIGIPLFEKAGRNIKLTIGGEVFLEYATHALYEIEMGKTAALRASDVHNNASIRVAAFRLHTANKLIEEYNKQAKQPIDIQMNHLKTAAIIEQLKRHSIDLGFCTYATADSDILFTPVASQHFVALVPRNHAFANLDSLTLEDLSRYPIIIPHGSDGMYSRIIGMFHAHGLSYTIACQADSINAAANLSSLGRGISITVEFPILSYFNLNIIPISNIPEQFYVYMAYARNRLNSDQMAPLISYLSHRAIDD